MADAANSAADAAIRALEMCERDFAFIGGCTMTDRPDLPLSPETSWQVDFSQVLAAIAAAKKALAGVRIAGECARCSNCPQTQPASGQTKYARAPQGSRMPAGERS